MISIGIILVAVAAYLAGWFTLAFWVLALAIANGALATAWSIINPDWYWQKRVEAGVSAHALEQHAHGPRSFVPSLLLSKGILIGVTLAAWHVGSRAGYF